MTEKPKLVSTHDGREVDPAGVRYEYRVVRPSTGEVRGLMGYLSDIFDMEPTDGIIDSYRKAWGEEPALIRRSGAYSEWEYAPQEDR